MIQLILTMVVKLFYKQYTWTLLKARIGTILTKLFFFYFSSIYYHNTLVKTNYLGALLLLMWHFGSCNLGTQSGTNAALFNMLTVLSDVESLIII